MFKSRQDIGDALELIFGPLQQLPGRQLGTGTTTLVIEEPQVATARAGSAFKIVENESPLPIDRVYLDYNGYINARVNSTFVPSVATTAAGPTTNANGDMISQTITTTTIPTIVTTPALQIHRQLLGFEKTFLDGDASVGVRLPVFEQDGGGFRTFIGDVSVIGKFLLLGDRETGNALTAGMAVTLPTGPALQTADGPIRSALLQPFLGFLTTFDDLYVQGFSSIVVPTNPRDVTFLANTLSVGYFLYRTDQPQLLSSVAPTVEFNLNTPLNHTSPMGQVSMPHILIMTAGVNFGLFNQAYLTLAVGVPVTGPKVFDIEAIARLNWRF